MQKAKIINDLNKVLKSKSNKITPSDRRKIRSAIKELEKPKPKKIDWDKVIRILSEVAEIVAKFFNKKE